MSNNLTFKDIVKMKNKPNIKPYTKRSNILKMPQVRIPLINMTPKQAAKAFKKSKRKKRKLTDVEKAYNRAYSQLKGAITRVESEGYEAYTQLPDKVKNPSTASINNLVELRALVLEQSFKVDDKGNKKSRLTSQIEEKKKKREETKKKRNVTNLRKELLQGEKVLTKSMQREYLSDIKSVIKSDLYGEDLMDMRGIIDTIMDSFFILKGPKYRAQAWIRDYEDRFVKWVQNATSETIKAARDRIEWKKFMIQFYSSEEEGIQPFLEGMRTELAKLVAIVPTNSEAEKSMSYADKLAAGLV